MNKSRHCGNGIACVQAMPRAALGFCFTNRADNLLYTHTIFIQGVLIHALCIG